MSCRASKNIEKLEETKIKKGQRTTTNISSLITFLEQDTNLKLLRHVPRILTLDKFPKILTTF